MRVGVIADLHANEQALEAVALALRAESVDRIVCAGDIVGYNASPAPVVAWVQERGDTVVLGNHDVGVVRGENVVGTSSAARGAQGWTRQQLGADAKAYLAALPALARDESGLLCAHGCYLNDRYYVGYVTSTMLRNNLDALIAHEGGRNVAVCGHTHMPMVSWLHSDTVVCNTEPGVHRWPRGADAVLINPGSVGQPRTGDPRACFAVVDMEAGTAELRRVDYDVQGAAAAIVRAGLPPDLAHRLKEGR